MSCRVLWASVQTLWVDLGAPGGHCGCIMSFPPCRHPGAPKGAYGPSPVLLSSCPFLQWLRLSFCGSTPSCYGSSPSPSPCPHTGPGHFGCPRPSPEHCREEAVPTPLAPASASLPEHGREPGAEPQWEMLDIGCRLPGPLPPTELWLRVSGDARGWGATDSGAPDPDGLTSEQAWPRGSPAVSSPEGQG